MLTRYVLLDLETVALPDAAQWLPKIEAPANYSKPETIDAYVKGETMKALDRAGLDADTCQIVVCGFQAWNDPAPHIRVSTTPEQEAETIATVFGLVGTNTPLLGYGLTWFDAGVLLRRAQILGVPVPHGFYRQGKYRHDWIVELADYLTLNGMIETRKGRGLDYHCKRLGIAVDDDYSGKEVAALWREGNIHGIRDHCRADLTRIRLLAERIGVIQFVNQKGDGDV